MECKWINICPLRRYEKQGKITKRWKKEYCQKDFKRCKRYQDGERGIPHPDNMMPDGNIKEELI